MLCINLFLPISSLRNGGDLMTRILIVLLALFCAEAHATKVLNLNVFDELQGTWTPDFRAKRFAALADFVSHERPDILVFQEAKGLEPGDKKGGTNSVDAQLFQKEYPHSVYIHEMTGKDGASYGYWIGAKKKPREWIEDGFAFSGGVERRVQGAIWGTGSACFGILSLHLSYQTTEVRQKEARWVLDWLKAKESKCKNWLVLGDFNADKEDAEMKLLFTGLSVLYKETKPTVGAFNPIRRIYGDNIPSRTIDWALGLGVKGEAQVVLDSPWKGEWVSDHAAVLVKLGDQKTGGSRR